MTVHFCHSGQCFFGASGMTLSHSTIFHRYSLNLAGVLVSLTSCAFHAHKLILSGCNDRIVVHLNLLLPTGMPPGITNFFVINID